MSQIVTDKKKLQAVNNQQREIRRNGVDSIEGIYTPLDHANTPVNFFFFLFQSNNKHTSDLTLLGPVFLASCMPLFEQEWKEWR